MFGVVEGILTKPSLPPPPRFLVPDSSSPFTFFSILLFLEFVSTRIEAFIDSHLKTLSSTTKDQFTNYVASILSTLKAPYTSLLDETNFYWDEILSRQYMFDRIERETKQIEDVTLAQIIETWETKMINRKSRRCFTVMVEPTKHANKVSNKEEDIAQVRDSFTSWDQPLMPPFEKRSSMGITRLAPTTDEEDSKQATPAPLPPATLGAAKPVVAAATTSSASGPASGSSSSASLPVVPLHKLRRS